MCAICTKWKKKEITAKDIMEEIGKALKNANPKKSDHLMALSSKILDDEVPMTESDAAADAKWWKQTHPEHDDGV